MLEPRVQHTAIHPPVIDARLSREEPELSPHADLAAPRVHELAFCDGGELGNFSVVDAGAYIGPAARIGAHCRVGANAWVEGIVLEGASVEAGAFVPAHVTVGRRATILAGSIVTADVADDAVDDG